MFLEFMHDMGLRIPMVLDVTERDFIGKLPSRQKWVLLTILKILSSIFAKTVFRQKLILMLIFMYKLRVWENSLSGVVRKIV